MRARNAVYTQIAGIRVARVHGQLGAVLDHRAHAVDVRKIQPGATPCEYRFIARVSKSTLPVRSPLPNKQPSTRSAPAIIASSAAAAVPRSLCGCTLRIRLSRRQMAVHPFDLVGVGVGVDSSTVAGRLMIILCCGVGCHTALTASQTSRANSGSQAEKVSGEYSNTHSVSGQRAVRARICSAPRTASALTPARSLLNTMRRNAGAMVVQMDNGAARACSAEWCDNQILARLRQHAQRHIRRHGVLFDQLADKIKIGLRADGNALDFF